MKKDSFVYAFGHFLVDFACAVLILSSGTASSQFLIYNFCAFALQMPIGLIADMVGRCKVFSVLGTILVMLGYLPIGADYSILLAGIGNACYHVGGGRHALLSDGKLTGLGIFVAPGAMGIFLGGLYAQNRLPVRWILSLLFLCLILLSRSESEAETVGTGKVRVGPFLLMMLIVLIRSVVGMSMVSPWKIGVFAVIAAICCSLGKAGGGLLSDRFGWKRTGVLSLVLSAVCFCFPKVGIFGCVGILLFQMTMPISLRKAAADLPGMEGFAFGCLTFALFLGYLPAYYGISLSGAAGGFLALISAVFMLLYREESP